MSEQLKKLSRQQTAEQLNNCIKLFHKSTWIPNIKKKTASKNKVDSLQDLLDYLRVCIKYTLFDLEASGRENEILKKLLDDNGIEYPKRIK